MERKHKDLTQLEDYCQEDWTKITADKCYNLGENYDKWLEQTIKARGHIIDH